MRCKKKLTVIINQEDSTGPVQIVTGDQSSASITTVIADTVNLIIVASSADIAEALKAVNVVAEGDGT